MNGGSQPLGTGTTFFNMMDFQQPKSQQTPAPAPAPVTPAPAPSAPAPAPAAAPSLVSYQDWLKNNPANDPRRSWGGGSVGGRERQQQGRFNAPMNARHDSQNQYMMEMIRQLGGLPEGSMSTSVRGGGYGRR